MTGYDEVLGQDLIKSFFRNSIRTGNVPHACILAGEAGMGKRKLAQAFAEALLCENGGEEACGQCHSCRQNAGGSHPDLIFVTHEKPSSIGVKDVREQIQDTMAIRPYNGRYKVYIVDEGELMTVQAQNALLKTIEEPPPYGVILLLTTNLNAFLPTILSRCIQLKCKPVSDQAGRKYLMDRLQVSEADAEIYAAFARGNMGKMIELATSEKFQNMYDRMVCLLKNIKTMDISELLAYIREMKDEETDIYDCLDFMQLWYRDILMYKVTRDVNLMIFKNERNAVNEICEKSGYDGLELIIQAIDKARIRLNANVNQDLALELMLLTMKEN